MLDFNHNMRRNVAVLGLTLSLFLTLSTAAWARDDSAVAYPRYEPPEVENLPEYAPTERPQIDLGKPSAETAPAEAPVVEAPAYESVPAVDPQPEVADEPEPAATEATPVVQAPAPGPQKLSTYKVWIWQENGDCLWRIAEKFYGDRTKWKLIYLANKDVIKDPNKIYPKQRIKIPPSDWVPVE